ncbi:MAG TPA: prepilin-type N-terminal cleavage/methylation domain-containing protein [Flavobacterium sp.]|nr:prepilin-type N-terminal cleavage/methylation domain-containing protein [Flavobacterium sp.]
MKVFKKNHGFTLVELLVVIAIIGLLASVVIVSVNSARAKARDSRRVADIKAVMGAIDLYRDANDGNAPASTGTIATDLAGLVTSSYIATIPTDPKNTGSYVYSYANTDGDDTYFLEFVTEQGSSLGDSGAYCASSGGMVASTGTCTEQ